MIFVDEFTDMSWIRILKAKGDTTTALENFISEVATPAGLKISMKHSRRQPTTRGGSNEFVVEELATARSLLVLRSKLNRRYEKQPFDELLCLSILRLS